jgi:hypothetical protein
VIFGYVGKLTGGITTVDDSGFADRSAEAINNLSLSGGEGLKDKVERQQQD